MTNISQETMMFKVNNDDTNAAEVILTTVYQSLKEKGYNPINQLVGYLLSGDPTYITSHNNARSLIRKLERDEIIEELVRAYLKDK
ncbi:IreB family regulatory phosphoprotein [Sporomusa sp.]|uniref:IreB family regulatory phosphoprotein n=1 Tax=Sporomusa sp. TaxID=2078658 RepID=UPI002C1B8D0C|nr:IreB family regulatory phosphoprotein [Sporomusa sp.]HWR44907.1 IreB family regulatory phosphoprotein [Sporomusa sp.]